MLKLIVGISLLSFCMSLSAKDIDHVVDFEQIKFEAYGRSSKHMVSTAEEPVETYIYSVGKIKIVDGKKGQALDISDSRTRTELKLKAGHYHDQYKGMVSFWISPKKAKFGAKGEVAIFEETNGDSLLGLYIDEAGKLKLKVKAIFPLDEVKKKVVYDAAYFNKIDNPRIKFENKTVIEKAADEKKRLEEELKKAEDAKNKPTFQVKDFSFYSFQFGDTSKWTEGQWNHIAVSYDFRRGFFAVLVNGKFVIRDYASANKKLGMYLNRGKSAKYLVFGPGNNGFSAAIDDIVISKNILDKETK